MDNSEVRVKQQSLPFPSKYLTARKHVLVSIYRIRTLGKNYPNPAVTSQCSNTALTKTMLIITCHMFSRCHDSEDCNRTLCETFSSVRQLKHLVVLVLSRGPCYCYTHNVCILILIFAEPLILTHQTPEV